MHYEINVSHNGFHYFATHARSLTTESAARDMYAHFRKVFPASQGFGISLTCWRTSGETLESDTTLARTPVRKPFVLKGSEL